MTTQSPSRALKAVLKKTFPGTKFNITTSYKNVNVDWTLEIGSNVTRVAVKEIADQHETLAAHGDLIDDTRWYSGYRVTLHPISSDERKAWTVSCVQDSYAAQWNEKWERFENENGKEDYYATKEYYHYLVDGVVCNLVSEYGTEPDAKYWYYKTNEETVEETLETVEETEIQPISIEVIEPVYVTAQRPTVSKQDWIEDYHEQEDVDQVVARINKIVTLAPTDYEKFTHSLLTDQAWLSGEGGNNSHYQSVHTDWIALLSDKEEYQKWGAESYTITVLVTDGRCNFILVDPQGHNYARYVLFVQTRLQTLIALIEETAKSVKSEVPELPELPEIVETVTEINYEALYQKRVERLLSEGKISEITSFIEWKSTIKDLL